MTSEDPRVLYRYRHLQGEHREWTKRILTDSVLHFAKPSLFNDPFDCKVHFRPSFSREELKQKYVDLVKKNIPELNRAQRRAKRANDLKTFEPDKFLAQMTSGLQDAIDGLGVLSLSATDRNILLWSHYAAGHTGLCLKFIATDETPFFGQAQPVDYTPIYPKVGLLSHSPDQQSQALLLTKAIDWKYEEEWRIINHNSGAGDKVFPEELLVGVTFGARMEHDEKEAVAEWVRRRKAPVQLSEVTLGSGSFSLEIEPYKPYRDRDAHR